MSSSKKPLIKMTSRSKGKTSGYYWSPAGLNEPLVEKFFHSFPPEQVPMLTNKQGCSFWINLFRKQYPKSDISMAYYNSTRTDQVKLSYTKFEEKLMAFLMDDRNKNALDTAVSGQLTKWNQICGYCKEPFKIFSLVVYCELLGTEPYGTFHPGCLRCNACKELLAFHVYCAFDNKPYCERHYMEKFLPRCVKCDHLIASNEYIKDSSQKWHMEHFNCDYCGQSLIDSQYVMREDNGEKKPICTTCYDRNYANVCEECQKPIGVDSKDLAYNDRHWHQRCFVCSQCKSDLYEKSFGSKFDKIYCVTCCNEKFAPRCCKCGEKFQLGQIKLDFGEQIMHSTCFCCKNCQLPIETKPFIPKGDDVYCSECFVKVFAKLCFKCGEILKGDTIKYRDNPWHADCFTCYNCKTGLKNISFITRDQQPYCLGCYANLFSKKCHKCRKPIAGTTSTLMFTHKNNHWHKECFRCLACDNLIQGGFFFDDKELFCVECVEKAAGPCFLGEDENGHSTKKDDGDAAKGKEGTEHQTKET